MKHADIVNKMSLEQKAALFPVLTTGTGGGPGAGPAQDHGNGRPSRPA